MDKRFIYMDNRFVNYVVSFNRMIGAYIVVIIEFADCMFMLITMVLMLLLVIKAKGVMRCIEWVIILVQLRSMMLVMIVWICVYHVYIVNMNYWFNIVDNVVV